jgi:predicted naringenin-chalcone synthase
MTLSKHVPAIIGQDLRTWIEGWLGAHGISLATIQSWAVHPGGPKILDGVEQALTLARTDLADSRAILADNGNMSSPTILFVLERLRRQNAPRPCVALAFGPGLTVEAALFE